MVAAARTAGGRASHHGGGIATSRFRPAAMGGPHGGGGPHGTPLRLGTRSRRGRRAPRGAPLHGGRQAANPWLGAIARCSRTGSSNPSLKRRVHCEPDFLGAWGCPSAARLRVSGVIARSPRKGQHFFETVADLATTNRADTGKHRGQNRRGSTTREIAPPKPSRRIPSVAERRPSHRTQGLIRLTAR
jgi:hypothetical protein